MNDRTKKIEIRKTKNKNMKVGSAAEWFRALVL